MTYIQALILGIVQGLTEFFPVSSSAHLRIAKKLLSISDGEHLLYFDLLCHAGTLLALIIFLRKEIWKVLKSFQQMSFFALAILPLFPAYFLMKPLRVALSEPSFLGYFFLLTSALLFLASKVRSPQPVQQSASKDYSTPLQSPKWKSVLWIGVAQTMALIPGISRSGSTIAMARFCGWSLMEGARFSFLLAVPTIIGGEILESFKLMTRGADVLKVIPWGSYAIGAISSFGVGLFAVQAVFWIYRRGRIRPFAWYCLGMGILALALFHG